MEKATGPVTKKEIAFIWRNYAKMPANAIDRKLRRHGNFARQQMKRLGIEVPSWALKKFIEGARIKPGSVPPNKGKKQIEYMSAEGIERTKATRFQKGQLPKNTCEEDFETRVRNDQRGVPQVFVRIAPRKWEYLSRALWRHHHGEIPARMQVSFKDGDTLNVDIANLELMSMQQNMARNTASANLPDGYVANTLAWCDKEKAAYIRKNAPGLIELKRQQLTLQREISNGKV